MKKKTKRRTVRKASKKSARKKPAKRVRPKPKKAAKKKLARKAPKPKPPKAVGAVKAPGPAIPGELVGHVTHYFPHVNAAVVKVKKGFLRVGDRLQFKGHTTDFIETLETIEIDHARVPEARAGAEVGLGVHERVREGDAVYRLR